MMLCVGTGAALLLSLSAPTFTLDWTHSVARTGWWEHWQVSDAGLAPVQARITGSGAGMEPPPEATFRDGAWWFTPQVQPQKSVVLAASGMTGGGWRLCAQHACHDLPEDQGPLHLWTSGTCEAPDVRPGTASDDP